MQQKIKPYIKCLIFIAGLIVIVALSDFFFAKTGYINYIIRQADSKENNENVFILGASHARCAIDPAAIEKNSDDRVLNMSIPGETIKDSYYLIQELNRTNDVEKVILDIDYNYWYGNLGEGCFAEPFLYNQYRWTSPVKWKYLIENTDMMDFRNAFTKKFVYKYELEDIKANVKQKMSKDYKDANIYIHLIQVMQVVHIQVRDSLHYRFRQEIQLERNMSKVRWGLKNKMLILIRKNILENLSNIAKIIILT